MLDRMSNPKRAAKPKPDVDEPENDDVDKPKYKNIITAANSGDELEILYQARILLAEGLAAGPPTRELPPLTKRLQEVNASIRELKERREQEDDPSSNGAAKPKAKGKSGWDAESI